MLTGRQELTLWYQYYFFSFKIVFFVNPGHFKATLCKCWNYTEESVLKLNLIYDVIYGFTTAILSKQTEHIYCQVLAHCDQL